MATRVVYGTHGQGTNDNYGYCRTVFLAQTKRRIVTVKNTAKHNPHEVVDKHNIRRTVVEPKELAAGLKIVGTQDTYYVVSMPDRTFGKVDIKTEKFLGKF